MSTGWNESYESSEQKFHDDYALDWERVLAELSASEVAGRSSIPALITHVVPALQASMIELLKAIEREEVEQAKHRAQLKLNPCLKPRTPFNALHWLASHLMRHNPRYGAALPGAEGTNQARPNYPISNEDFQWCLAQGISENTVKLFQDQFNLLDASHLGRLSVAGFQKALASLGIYPDQNALRQMVQQVGGSTGTIGFRDFVQLQLSMQRNSPELNRPASSPMPIRLNLNSGKASPDVFAAAAAPSPPPQP